MSRATRSTLEFAAAAGREAGGAEAGPKGTAAEPGAASGEPAEPETSAMEPEVPTAEPQGTETGVSDDGADDGTNNGRGRPSGRGTATGAILPALPRGARCLSGKEAFHTSQAPGSIRSIRAITTRPSAKGRGADGKYFDNTAAGNPTETMSRAQYLMCFLEGLNGDTLLTQAKADRS